MPEMDGFEMAKLMRLRPESAVIPIIFVTAISKEEQHVFHGYESGGVDYLAKPFEPIILVSKANVFLALHAKNEEICQAK
jgi:DNA-binding response OmpR family regulator